MDNQADAADHANLLLNRYIEGELRYGKGRSYGFEVTLEKNTGKLQGYFGYTYARAKRTISDINNGQEYNAPFDMPHTVDLSLSYDLNQRSSFGFNWGLSDWRCHNPPC